jgi:hypothetical protein
MSEKWRIRTSGEVRSWKEEGSGIKEIRMLIYLKTTVSEANILDAKKLVWSQVALRCTELFLLESQTSRGEVRNLGLLGFEFKIDFFKDIFG